MTSQTPSAVARRWRSTIRSQEVAEPARRAGYLVTQTVRAGEQVFEVRLQLG